MRILLHCMCLGVLPVLEVKNRKPTKREGWAAQDDDTDDDDTDDDHHHGADDTNPAAHALAHGSAWLLRPAVEFYHVVNIPAVKFATHNLFAVAFTTFLAIGLCGMPWEGTAWMRRTGLQDTQVPSWEIIAMVWNLLRFIGARAPWSP